MLFTLPSNTTLRRLNFKYQIFKFLFSSLHFITYRLLQLECSSFLALVPWSLFDCCSVDRKVGTGPVVVRSCRRNLAVVVEEGLASHFSRKDGLKIGKFTIYMLTMEFSNRKWFLSMTSEPVLKMWDATKQPIKVLMSDEALKTSSLTHWQLFSITIKTVNMKHYMSMQLVIQQKMSFANM